MEDLSPEKLVLGLVWYVVFLLSLTCHEAAHALAAKIGGDPTAFEAGQMTLDPRPHIRRSPFGTILVPILSYLLAGWMIGWASAPYNPYWEQRHPRRAAWMALAGPLANFALILIAAIGIHLGMVFGIFNSPKTATYIHIVAPVGSGFQGALAVFLSILFSLNLLLFVFNLLPVPPLDGSTAIGIFINEKTMRRILEFTRNPMFNVVGLLFAWKILDYIFSPIFTIALNLLYPGAGYH